MWYCLFCLILGGKYLCNYTVLLGICWLLLCRQNQKYKVILLNEDPDFATLVATFVQIVHRQNCCQNNIVLTNICDLLLLLNQIVFSKLLNLCTTLIWRYILCIFFFLCWLFAFFVQYFKHPFSATSLTALFAEAVLGRILFI